VCYTPGGRRRARVGAFSRMLHNYPSDESYSTHTLQATAGAYARLEGALSRPKEPYYARRCVVTQASADPQTDTAEAMGNGEEGVNGEGEGERGQEGAGDQSGLECALLRSTNESFVGLLAALQVHVLSIGMHTLCLNDTHMHIYIYIYIAIASLNCWPRCRCMYCFLACIRCV